MKTTNDIKKGEVVLLANGWQARIEDNRKGQVRLATVFGTYTDIGSIYASDIRQVQTPSGEWESVSITSKQKTLADNRKQWGF
jgi:hypothetical protein